MEKPLVDSGQRAGMYRSVLTAAGLIASLHLLAPHLAPRMVEVDALPGHLGETVALVASVVEVEPGARFHRVTVQDATGAANVLMDTDPPPRGTIVRIIGQPAGDDEGIIVWVRSLTIVDEVPPGRTLDVDVALREAPRLQGVPITVVGHWTVEGLAFDADERGLPVELDDPPAPGELVAVRGAIRYSPASASYHLDAIGWFAWSHSRPSAWP